jgi:hypothetical protein
MGDLRMASPLFPGFLVREVLESTSLGSIPHALMLGTGEKAFQPRPHDWHSLHALSFHSAENRPSGERCYFYFSVRGSQVTNYMPMR